MPRKSVPAKVAAHLTDTPIGLAVKDGLREVRFNLKRSARKWVPGADTPAAESRLSVPSPRLLLDDPLGVAVRTTAQLLRSADDVAIELLSSDLEYRAMQVPLAPSADHFATDVPTRPFTRDHYWRYRHLLAAMGLTDQFVHEQRIERAAQELRTAVRRDREQGAALSPQRLRARIVIALRDAQVVSPAFDADAHEAEASRRIGGRAALGVVLAGDIASRGPGSVRECNEAALRLADEVTAGAAAQWQRALASPEPDAALATWIDFALRHV